MTECEIFTEALERSDLAERTAYLDGLVGAETPARKRIDLLLAAHALSDPLLDTNPAQWLGLKIRTAPIQPTTDLIDALQPFLEMATRPDSLGRLGHHEILQVLGCGGFGVVLKAFDDNLHRVVAVKVLLPHLAATSLHRNRFLREARAAAAIRHESVVHIYAVEESPLPYLVMEYCEGPTLQEHLERTGRFDAKEVVHFGKQIALGLAAAHDRGLIHRDVKPSNLLLELGRVSRVKLTDFGLARATDDSDLDPVTLAGSPPYMSPEQVRGDGVGPPTDQFSLGSVLYAMCVGSPPFHDSTPLAVLKRVVTDTPKPIRKLVPDIPEGLCDVIARLHRKDPVERFATTHDVVEALSQCLNEPPLKFRRIRTLLSIAGASLAVIGLVVLTPVLRDQPKWEAPLKPEPTWEETVAVQQVGQQIEAVRQRLKERNPSFDENKVVFQLTDGLVRKVVFKNTAKLFDMSPLRALPDLKVLEITGRGVIDITSLRGLKLTTFSSNGNPIKDLSPLAEMPLEYLGVWGGACSDLSPLRGKMLLGGNFGAGPISDITALNGMAITMLCLNETPLQDISPLKGMPLRRLELARTLVSDISPLKGAPIESLDLTASPIKDYTVLQTMRQLSDLRFDYDPVQHGDLIRSLPSLKFLNGKPAGDVLTRPLN